MFEKYFVAVALKAHHPAVAHLATIKSDIVGPNTRGQRVGIQKIFVPTIDLQQQLTGCGLVIKIEVTRLMLSITGQLFPTGGLSIGLGKKQTTRHHKRQRYYQTWKNTKNSSGGYHRPKLRVSSLLGYHIDIRSVTQLLVWTELRQLILTVYAK